VHHTQTALSPDNASKWRSSTTAGRISPASLNTARTSAAVLASESICRRQHERC